MTCASSHADDSPGASSPAPLRRQDFAGVAYSVEQDFRRIVEVLMHAIDIVGDADEELALRLSRTKSVAERGVRLSRLVSKLTRNKRDGGA